MLWRITPPHGGPDSYLFGTMHVRDLRAFEWLETAQNHLAQCEVFATEFDFNEIDSSFQERGIKPISWDEKEKKITTNRKYVVLGEYGEMWLGGEVSDDKTYTRIIYSPKFREPSIKVVLNENLKNGKEIISNKIKETQNTPAPKVEVIKNDTQEISDTTNIGPDIKKENFRNPNQKHFFQGYSFIEHTGLRPGDYSVEEVNVALKNKGFEPISDEDKPESYFYYEIKKIPDTQKTNNVLYSQK